MRSRRGAGSTVRRCVRPRPGRRGLRSWPRLPSCSASGAGRDGDADIAQAAQVSLETVFANFGSKAALLKHALDVAVVGDDEPAPLLDRPQFRELAEGDLQDRAQAAGYLLATRCSPR